MSDVIKLLPDHIANQIAAGEVIQRPASVVKELVENAIDAGATKIDVLIKDAGKTLIQVVDNGKGMSPFDARMCFERHATSKVQSADDLFHLTTKGFRGEALASIAAISHTTLKTKQPGSELGHLNRIEGSKITQEEIITCPIGTSFEVKNLFFNVPARRNFLKSESVEFRHILDEFERIVLPHPEISFTIQHNETVIYNLPSCNLKKRILDILGTAKSSEKLVPIDEETDIVKIKGFVGKPEFAKKKRGEQFFFVNNRFFKDHYFNHSINKAYEGLIQDKTFPTYFIFFEIVPEKIDVNVHPTKTEIKFEEDKLIYAILLSTIRQSLGKYNIAPTLDFSRETSFDIPYEMKNQPTKEPTIKVDESYNPFNVTTSKKSSNGSSSGNSPAIKAAGFGSQQLNSDDWKSFYDIEEEVEQEKQTLDIEIDEELVSAKNFIKKENYIVGPTKNGLLVIHFKRAIERITYDQLMQSFILHPIASQQLLFPFEKEANQKEKMEWKQNENLLKQLGFNAEITDKHINISAIPNVLQEENVLQCVDEILESLTYQSIDQGDVAHFLIKAIAYATSRKKSPLATEETIQHLINELFQCEDHIFSPRKKRIMTTITMDEINVKF